jgi:hypothetical protein
MSTNYYVRTPDTPADDEGIHLGKRSIGWQFTFRAYPDPAKAPAPVTWPVVDTESWMRLLDLGNIYDERGQIMTSTELLDVIESSIGGRTARGSADEFTDDAGARFIPAEFC